MSPVARLGLGWLSLVGAAFLLPMGGCSAPSKGALVLAISTDMQAPKDIDVVSVYITTNGTPKFDYLGRVLPDGTVSLPSTLAIVEPDALDAQVRIRVIAFQTQPNGSANARVLRDVLTTVPHERTALLRVPLDFLDDGSGIGSLPSQYVPDPQGGVPEGDTSFQVTQIGSICDFVHDNETSINGVCTDATVESSTLESYTVNEVYGDGGLQANGTPASCFDVASCFAGATAVVNLDPQECSFPMPEGADPSTLNVALVGPNTGTCVAPGQCYVPLPEDATAGWTSEGSTVQLVAGVCAKLNGGVALALSTGPCGAETLSEPICEPGEVVQPSDAGNSGPDASTVGCDGNYLITCQPNDACGADAGGTAGLVVSGSAGTLGVPTNGSDGGDQISPIAVLVNPTTCQASFTFPSSTGSCSPSGMVMLDLVSGATSGIECANSDVDGACMVGMLSCTVARAPEGNDGGAVVEDATATACPTQEMLCNGTCVNLQTDMNNCGRCNNPCTADQTCQEGVCVMGGAPGDASAAPACTPLTCSALGYNCGPAGDGCGGTLECGTCTGPQFCGGGGFSLCGGNINADGGSCSRETCEQQNISCGPAGDGCGNQLACGECTPPATCGGGGAPFQCGGGG